MLKVLLALAFSMYTLTACAAVRWNPMSRAWEGNICANQYAWTYVAYQPIGSFCAIRLPNGQIMQGIIINQ